MAEAIKGDSRSEVKEIKYEVEEQWDWYEEYVKILFKSGITVKKRVTGDSCYGLLTDISKAVYA